MSEIHFIIYFLTYFMKRFCILLALLALAVSQFPTETVVGNRMMPPPIAIHDQDVLDSSPKPEDAPVQIHKQDSVVQPIGEIQPNHPILGGQEDMIHLPGRQEFNPFEYRPESPFDKKPRHPNPYHRTPQMRTQSQNDDMNRDLRRNDRNRPQGEWERGQFRSSIPNHDDWERHVEGNHMQKLKYHRKMKCVVIATAIVFTLVGLCLAKCCRKCKKNRKQRVRAMMMRSRTAEDINEEIKHEERRLDQLKTQYAQKRAEEERLRRQHQAQNQAYEMHMRQRQMSQPRAYYAQPHSQEMYYNPHTSIPVGRPINESRNSSFATEYPQL